MTLVAPSILSADFSRLGEEVEAVDQAGADWIHIDVMDGHFVPPITIGPLVVEAIRPRTTKFFDCHLMVENPDHLIPHFVEAGADQIAVHPEACRNFRQTIELIRREGARVSAVLNPEVPIDVLEGYWTDIDNLLFMSVNPGWGGQPFIEEVLDKLRVAARRKREEGWGFSIEVDGGVKTHNAPKIVEAGAEVLVAGSAIFGSDDYAATILQLREST